MCSSLAGAVKLRFRRPKSISATFGSQPAETLHSSWDGSSRSYFYSRCFYADNSDSGNLSLSAKSAGFDVTRELAEALPD